MSYLVTAPDYLIAAALDLTGIQASLGAASAAASAPTTAVVSAAADEVSAAISQFFGTYGQEFQALNAQAAAFHDEFVKSLNGSAAAYAGAETLGAAPLDAPAQLLLSGSPSSAALPLAAPGGAYQELFANTQTNLQSFQTAWSADPAPLLRQVLTNQQAYAQTIATETEYTVTHLPAVLANLPGDIRAVLEFNPTPYLQHFIANQTAYANVISTSLQNAGQSFSTGLQALPAAFQTAFQDLQTGNFGGAASTLGSGFLDLFFTGADVKVTPLPLPIGVDVLLKGTVGDLLPILAIPGQEAQDFTNLLPAGSVPSQMSQNFTRVVKALTDTTISAKVPDIDPVSFKIDAYLGLPLALAFQAAGAPVATFSAASTSASAISDAVQTGNALTAFQAVIDAPAVVADGFLNGQVVMSETINIGSGVPPLLLDVPFNGILVPQAPLVATIDWGAPIHTKTYNVGGTQFGGLMPALYGASSQLADLIKPA